MKCFLMGAFIGVGISLVVMANWLTIISGILMIITGTAAFTMHMIAKHHKKENKS